MTDTNQISRTLNTLVDSWFENREEAKGLRADIKELNDAKKQYEVEIIGLLESKGENQVSTGSGTLNLIRKEVKKSSASKKQLKEIFEQAEEGEINIKEPAQACEYIFNMFPMEEHLSLKAAKTDLP
jgi:seryl-tRNA synthetase